MEIDRETLLKLAREDCRIRADWLQIWTAFAEEALEKEEFWEVLYGFLFWAETESQRRRAYLAVGGAGAGGRGAGGGEKGRESPLGAGETADGILPEMKEKTSAGAVRPRAFSGSLPGEPRPIPVDLLLIPVLLREYAAAVFLHIEAQLPGPAVSFPEVWPEIPVQKFYAVPLRAALRCPGNALMVLIEAGQQGSSKSPKTVFGGILRRLLNAVLIAVSTPAADIPCHMADKIPEAVILSDPNLHAGGRSIFQQAIPAGLVFLPRMDIGIVPKSHWFHPFGPERINAAQGTGRTAAVEQNSIHGHASFLL